MENTNLGSSSKHGKFILVFCVLLLILSVVWRVIFAEDGVSSNSTTYNTSTILKTSPTTSTSTTNVTIPITTTITTPSTSTTPTSTSTSPTNVTIPITTTTTIPSTPITPTSTSTSTTNVTIPITTTSTDARITTGTTSTTTTTTNTAATTTTTTTPTTQGNAVLFEQINILQNKLNNTTDAATQIYLKAQISALQAQVQTLESNQATPQGTSQAPVTTPTTNVFSSKVQDLGLVVEEFKMAVGDIKEQLIRTINGSVANIIINIETSGQTTNLAKINNLRDQLLIKVDAILGTSTIITSSDLSNLKKEINKRISEIKLAAGENATTTQTGGTSTTDITNTLNTLSTTINNQSETLKNQGGDLLYKDTNKDGISDYDSVYVYNMSPTTPSPVSTYEGKNINASDKILLGFDPTQSKIVKVEKQQPVESTIAPVSTYKVKEVALTEKKEVIFKGQALPNSFITIYIYSTPIMVTVKTDSNGEWQYVLDKELENGNHTVYTASVNNSGNIIAKSSGFLFTKTAEAVTLNNLPNVETSVSAEKPGLLEGMNYYLVIVGFLAISIIVLILAGIISKKNNPN